MNGERQGYQAYLLRLWQVHSGGKWVWRVTLESPHTGERQVFTSLEQLFAHLGEQCDRQVPDGPEVPGT